MSERGRIDLAGHLRPVSAPPGLWQQIEARMEGRMELRGPRGLPFAPVLASTVMLLTGALWIMGARQPSSLEAHVAAAKPVDLDLTASAGHRLRAWLASQGIFGERIGAAEDARFVGARRDGATTLVFFRLNTRLVTVAFADGGPAEPGTKRILSRTLSSGARLFDWHSKGQRVLLVSSVPEGAEHACRVCHT